jgi:DNA modification methylase
MGKGTSGAAAVKLGRSFTGIELSPEYFQLAERHITDAQMVTA